MVQLAWQLSLQMPINPLIDGWNVHVMQLLDQVTKMLKSHWL